MQEFRTGTPTAAEPRILRVNVAGQPVEWLHWQEAVGLYARDLVIWTLGDPVMKIRGGFSRILQAQTVLQLHSIIACDGHIVHSLRSTPPLTNRALFRRDANICMYCGNTFLDKDLTRDHVCRVRRAARIRENVVRVSRCNHHKGNRLLADTSGVQALYAELCRIPGADQFGRILGDRWSFSRSVRRDLAYGIEAHDRSAQPCSGRMHPRVSAAAARSA